MPRFFMRGLAVATIVVGAAAYAGRAQAPAAPSPMTIAIRTDAPGAPIPSTLFGIFFEDINFAADGGIYPERIKNRSIRVPRCAHGMEARGHRRRRGSFAVQTDRPFHAGDSALRAAHERRPATYGITNDGFRGISARKGESLFASRWSRVSPATRRPACAPSSRTTAATPRSAGPRSAI